MFRSYNIEVKMYDLLQKNGECKTWRRDGSVMVQWVEKDSLKHGELIYRWSSGNVRVRCGYKKGLFEGKYMSYSKGGCITSNDIYKDGKKIIK